MAATTTVEPLAPLGLESAALTAEYRDDAKADLINNYWKLDTIDPELAAQLVSLDSTVVEHQLTYRRATIIYKRLQRQMVLYDCCTIEELKQFCANRRISIGAANKDETRAIIQALEYADHVANFPQLRLLPAELREEIYKHYMLDLETAGIFPTEPPLLRANRQIRHEARPLFYRRRRFTVTLPLESKDNIQVILPQYNRLAAYERLLGSNGPANVLAMVEKLRVHGEIQHYANLSNWWVFELEEGTEGCLAYKKHTIYSAPQYNASMATWGSLLSMRLKCLRARFDARGEGLGLKPGDLDEFLQVFSRSATGLRKSEMEN